MLSLPQLVCPLSNFAKKYGYEEYMPYLCNLDYVMFGIVGAPLYREHTCFEDGEYCDFKMKVRADILPYWPPVFSQDNPYNNSEFQFYFNVFEDNKLQIKTGGEAYQTFTGRR